MNVRKRDLSLINYRHGGLPDTSNYTQMNIHPVFVKFQIL